MYETLLQESYTYNLKTEIKERTRGKKDLGKHEAKTDMLRTIGILFLISVV